MTDQQLLDDLVELERAGWRSLCESTGDLYFGDLMTDDALMVLANGAVMDRDAVTAALGQAPLAVLRVLRRTGCPRRIRHRGIGLHLYGRTRRRRQAVHRRDVVGVPPQRRRLASGALSADGARAVGPG